MRIALDVDGVLADVMVPWIKNSNTFRAPMTKKDAHNWYFWREMGIEKDAFYRELDACWKDWRSIPPTEDDLAGATAGLAKLGEVDIVTARSPATDGYVKEWLAHHGIAYSGYVSVPAGAQKAKLNYDVFIDDAPINARKMREAGRRVIVYAQPWNASLEAAGFVLVRDLAGAINEINASRQRT